MDQVIPNDKLRLQIEAWVAERKAIAAAKEAPKTDTST
jgi:hypothetical protein